MWQVGNSVTDYACSKHKPQLQRLFFQDPTSMVVLVWSAEIIIGILLSCSTFWQRCPSVVSTTHMPPDSKHEPNLNRKIILFSASFNNIRPPTGPSPMSPTSAAGTLPPASVNLEAFFNAQRLLLHCLHPSNQFSTGNPSETNRPFYTYRVLQQVLDKELSVKISNLAKLEFSFCQKKFVKLKGDMLCLAWM